MRTLTHAWEVNYNAKQRTASAMRTLTHAREVNRNAKQRASRAVHSAHAESLAESFHNIGPACGPG